MIQQIIVLKLIGIRSLTFSYNDYQYGDGNQLLYNIKDP